MQSGSPVGLVFQSIAGSQKGNDSFGISVGMLDEAYEMAKKYCFPKGPNFMYFETGQGSALSADAHNGWDQLTDANKGKTLELGATLNPIKPLNIAVSGYAGKEPTTATTDGMRTSINAVVSYTIIDPLSVGVELLSVSQDNVGGAGTKQKYSGEALYVTYMFMPKLRGVLRGESFNDKDGFHFTTPDTKYREVTATVSYLASDSFEARVEARQDKATNAVFTDSTGATSKSLTTFALQGLYKF
jgi:hypothetical protein